MTQTIQWSSIQDPTSWDVDPTTGCTSKPKVPPYFLDTTSHSILHFRLEQRGWRIDRNVVLHRVGRALGILR